MLFKSYQCATKSYARHFFTNVRRNLFKDHVDSSEEARKRRLTTVNYVTATGALAIGLAYAAVPLYRIFCQSTSYGGTLTQDDADLENMKPIKERLLKIRFNADTASAMAWNFKPQQRELRVVPGETALAFYTATNPTDRTVTGVSTYNVVPFEVGQYFNKIQCFCFEEQQLNANEQVDMPVFFYIDPEFAEDPKMEFIDEITLSYTFFEAKEGLNLPMPSYMKRAELA